MSSQSTEQLAGVVVLVVSFVFVMGALLWGFVVAVRQWKESFAADKVMIAKTVRPEQVAEILKAPGLQWKRMGVAYTLPLVVLAVVMVVEEDMRSCAVVLFALWNVASASYYLLSVRVSRKYWLEVREMQREEASRTTPDGTHETS